MDGGAWWASVHGVAKSRTRLSDFIFTFPFHALEKEMATHASVLAWRIPGMGEPGGLPFLGSHRVEHDWNDLAAGQGRFLGVTLGFPVCLSVCHLVFVLGRQHGVFKTGPSLEWKSLGITLCNMSSKPLVVFTVFYSKLTSLEIS